MTTDIRYILEMPELTFILALQKLGDVYNVRKHVISIHNKIELIDFLETYITDLVYYNEVVKRNTYEYGDAYLTDYELFIGDKIYEDIAMMSLDYSSDELTESEIVALTRMLLAVMMDVAGTIDDIVNSKEYNPRGLDREMLSIDNIKWEYLEEHIYNHNYSKMITAQLQISWDIDD